eukprot:6599958-Prymnesium_polylepis.1
MPFSPRTARGCIPRCVYQRQRPRGLERPCLLVGWKRGGYTLVATYMYSCTTSDAPGGDLTPAAIRLLRT